MEWISVKERLPEIDTPILGWHKMGKAFIYWFDGTKDFPLRDGFGGRDGKSVTHWMPLPDPPKEPKP